LKDQLKGFRDALEKKVEELRRSQEELEASRNKYAFLYDFAPVGYFSLDRGGLIKTVNRTGSEMMGKKAEALMGQRFANLIWTRIGCCSASSSTRSLLVAARKPAG